jgi:hypothetical protein
MDSIKRLSAWILAKDFQHDFLTFTGLLFRGPIIQTLF